MKVTRRGQVEFVQTEEGILIRKLPVVNKFEAWSGFLGQPGDSDALVREMRGHRD
jgi:hypothetical protein